jgi:tetratricopeptide (TPR) repeat protein
MNRAADKLVKKATALNLAGKPEEALRIVDDLLQETSDHSIKFGLLYYEMMWLLDMGAISQAREKFNEMQVQISCIDDLSPPQDSLATTISPQDTDQDDLAAYLAVISRFAEAQLFMKERNEALALEVLEDLMSRYPKQLSLRKFRELRGETHMHRGMLLANADRWLEAGVFLEQAIPPKVMRPVFCYYLGQYYYTVRDYKRATKYLKESVTKDMPSRWQSPVHYMLGLSEYHLFHNKEAKKHFELSVRTADSEYIRKNDIWGWLERTSRALGLDMEAENYRKIQEEPKDHEAD